MIAASFVATVSHRGHSTPTLQATAITAGLDVGQASSRLLNMRQQHGLKGNPVVDTPLARVLSGKRITLMQISTRDLGVALSEAAVELCKLLPQRKSPADETTNALMTVFTAIIALETCTVLTLDLPPEQAATGGSSAAAALRHVRVPKLAVVAPA